MVYSLLIDKHMLRQFGCIIIQQASQSVNDLRDGRCEVGLLFRKVLWKVN